MVRYAVTSIEGAIEPGAGPGRRRVDDPDVLDARVEHRQGSQDSPQA